VRGSPAGARRRPVRGLDPARVARAHDCAGRAGHSGAPGNRPRAGRSAGSHHLAVRAWRRREPTVPTRPVAVAPHSRRRSLARRRVAAAPEAARARSAAAARPERRRIRLATRDTGSARPARLRGGRWSGVHGHDGGDADVRSCSADGQGENSRVTRRARSRRAVCDESNRSVAVWNGSGDVSRKYRTAAPWELGRCRKWSDATGALPRSPAGADPSRGVRRNGPTWGAALRLASCLRQRRNTGLAARRCSVGRCLSAVGPTDATSIANNLDSRNPHVRLRTSCPGRGASAPRPVGSARASALPPA